ncbi:MAG: HRDC domain-containing protein [Thermoleophilia bacterium]
MPDTHAEVIRDGDGVARLAEHVRRVGTMAIDFEFLWERTYAPHPCLVQVAVEDQVLLVDPLEGAPLEPLAELVADPAILTIMHAPSADLTLLGMKFDTRPTNLVDVQLTAGFVGLGSGQGLSVLLDRVLRVRLDKGEQYTDWSRRPLSERQLRYAEADVSHLHELWARLRERAGDLGRLDWVDEEHERRYGPEARFTPDPDEAWRKVKGQGKLTAKDRAVLQQLARWRELEALRRDRPAAWIVPDRTLLEVARRRPTSADRLTQERGLPERLRASDLQGMLQAIRVGVENEPIAMPSSLPAELQGRLDALVGLGQILVSSRAAEVDLAPSLLATRDDVENYLAQAIGGRDGLNSPLAHGWRHKLAGAPLLDLAAGRIALAAADTRPYLREIPRRPED